MVTYSECIDACEACVLACEKFSTRACVADDVLRRAMECTQACELAIIAMSRDGCIAPAACSACARLCEACEKSCLACEDPEAWACARACARAAAGCYRACQAAWGVARWVPPRVDALPA